MLLSIVFPRTTTCDYKFFGSGGGPSNTNSRCVMALNAVSEKVFVILWFWFLLLIVINIANLIILVLMAVKSQGIRKLFIRKSAGSKTVSLLLFFFSASFFVSRLSDFWYLSSVICPICLNYPILSFLSNFVHLIHIFNFVHIVQFCPPILRQYCPIFVHSVHFLSTVSIFLSTASIFCQYCPILWTFSNFCTYCPNCSCGYIESFNLVSLHLFIGIPLFQTGRDLRETKLDKELKKLDFGQFLFLYFLGRNIDYTTFRAILKAIAPEPNEVETEGIAMQALGEPSAPERRGSDLPGYTDLAPQAATKDPYPYPSIEPCEKDTGDEEINAPKKEL